MNCHWNEDRAWVYAPYYVLQSIENRASDFFILTIYDKNDMFCHIWKHEASHPQ